jgi:DNA-binding winged helix-turn-helix (wHTH) protein
MTAWAARRVAVTLDDQSARALRHHIGDDARTHALIQTAGHLGYRLTIPAPPTT